MVHLSPVLSPIVDRPDEVKYRTFVSNGFTEPKSDRGGIRDARLVVDHLMRGHGFISK